MNEAAFTQMGRPPNTRHDYCCKIAITLKSPRIGCVGQNWGAWEGGREYCLCPIDGALPTLEPRFLRPWFRTLQTCEECFFLRKLIRLSPVSNSVQYDIPAKDVIAQPVVSRPDAPLSLSRFQARQLFDIVPTRLVIRVLRKDIEKPVENA